MPSALFLALDDHHHVGCNVWKGRTEPDGLTIRLERG